MAVLKLLAVVFLVALVVGVVLGAVALVRAARSVKLNLNAADEARIKRDEDDVAKRVDEQAQKDKTEVANAKGGKLLSLARARLFKR